MQFDKTPDCFERHVEGGRSGQERADKSPSPWLECNSLNSKADVNKTKKKSSISAVVCSKREADLCVVMPTLAGREDRLPKLAKSLESRWTELRDFQ